MKLPAPWREDAEFILEYSGIGPGEREGLKNILRQKRRPTDNQAQWFARLAVQCFVDVADYKQALGERGPLI